MEESPQTSCRGHGKAGRVHSQTTDMQAFALQPAGQAQRKACLLGQRILPDVLQQKKIGREILRRAGRIRAAAPVRRFGYLRSTTLPSYQTVRGSCAQRFCPARSVPRIQNLRLLSVPPGNRQCRRTYRENGWFSLHSPFKMYFWQCSSAHGTSPLKQKKPGKTVRSLPGTAGFCYSQVFSETSASISSPSSSRAVSSAFCPARAASNSSSASSRAC